MSVNRKALHNKLREKFQSHIDQQFFHEFEKDAMDLIESQSELIKKQAANLNNLRRAHREIHLGVDRKNKELSKLKEDIEIYKKIINIKMQKALEKTVNDLLTQNSED